MFLYYGWAIASAIIPKSAIALSSFPQILYDRFSQPIPQKMRSPVIKLGVSKPMTLGKVLA
jgi:hypothetical protein